MFLGVPALRHMKIAVPKHLYLDMPALDHIESAVPKRLNWMWVYQSGGA